MSSHFTFRDLHSLQPRLLLLDLVFPLPPGGWCGASLLRFGPGEVGEQGTEGSGWGWKRTLYSIVDSPDGGCGFGGRRSQSGVH